jgi:hypothetical protein
MKANWLTFEGLLGVNLEDPCKEDIPSLPREAIFQGGTVPFWDSKFPEPTCEVEIPQELVLEVAEATSSQYLGVEILPCRILNLAVSGIASIIKIKRPKKFLGLFI